MFQGGIYNKGFAYEAISSFSCPFFSLTSFVRLSWQSFSLGPHVLAFVLFQTQKVKMKSVDKELDVRKELLFYIRSESVVTRPARINRTPFHSISLKPDRT